MIQEKDNPEKQKLRAKLYDQVKWAFKTEKVNPNIIAYLYHMSNSTVNNIKKNKEISLSNLIKITQAIGYDVLLVKRTDLLSPSENPELQEKINKFKLKQLNAQRRKRGLPEGQLPPKIRIRKPKRIPETVSRKSLEDSFFKQDDFLNAP